MKLWSHSVLRLPFPYAITSELWPTTARHIRASPHDTYLIETLPLPAPSGPAQLTPTWLKRSLSRTMSSETRTNLSLNSSALSWASRRLSLARASLARSSSQRAWLAVSWSVESVRRRSVS